MADSNLQVSKGAVLLNKGEVQVLDWLEHLKNNWKELTAGLCNATILILAGRHGNEDGSIGPKDKYIMFNHEGLVCSLNSKHSDASLFKG